MYIKYMPSYSEYRELYAVTEVTVPKSQALDPMRTAPAQSLWSTALMGADSDPAAGLVHRATPAPIDSLPW